MKLWAKDIETDKTMERLTVGDDRVSDSHLMPFDCLGSAAHAQVLNHCGVLTNEETSILLKALKELHAEALRDSTKIPDTFEDVHSYLEFKLTEKLGDVGKKIHTGRSRNDQVILAMRLFLRSAVLTTIESLGHVAEAFSARFKKDKDLLMPGYTHLQPAMPTTTGAWLHAFLEGTLELMRDGFALLNAMNTNPLGAAAGFGSSLPLDREFSSVLLEFDRAQRSFIDIQNSRGRYEDRFLYWCTQIGAVYEKFAWDVELFCTREFDIIKLPDSLTTGSSIMPQKKNPDIVELLRARCGMMRGIHAQLQWTAAKLPSHYHRDYQLTKSPVMQGVREIRNILDSVLLIVPAFEFKVDSLRAKIHPELFATYEAYKLVRQDVPFREAYKKTAEIAMQGNFKPTDYKNEIATIASEVERYESFSVSELLESKARIYEWDARLQRMAAKVFVTF